MAFPAPYLIPDPTMQILPYSSDGWSKRLLCDTKSSSDRADQVGSRSWTWLSELEVMDVARVRLTRGFELGGRWLGVVAIVPEQMKLLPGSAIARWG